MASANNLGAIPDSGQNNCGKEEAPMQINSQKTKGSATGAGEDFEIHMIALVFLRLINAGADFSIDSNVGAAGLFDDIVLRYRIPPDTAWHAALMQLKHKNNAILSIKEFISIRKDADFSLLKYGKSYQKLKATDASGNGLKLPDNSFEDVQFVLFTNAKIGKVMDTEQGYKTGPPINSNATLTGNEGGTKPRWVTKLAELATHLSALREMICESESNAEQLGLEILSETSSISKSVDKIFENLELQSLIDTGGKCISLENHKVILESLAEWIHLKSNRDNLNRDAGKWTYESHLVNMFKQDLLKPETKTNVSQLECIGDMTLYKEILTKLKFYTNQARQENILVLIKDELEKAIGVSEADVVNKFVKEVKDLWRDRLNKCLTKEAEFWKSIISSEKRKLSHKEPDCFAVKFDENHLKIFYETIPRAGIVNLKVGSLTTVSYVRMMKAFQNKGMRVLHVDMAKLISKPDQILGMWSSKSVHHLVIDCSTVPDSDISHISEKISNTFDVQNSGKLVVVVAKEDHLLNKKLSGSKSYKVINENFSWNDLTEDTKKDLLSSETLIILQGRSISLQDVLTIDEECVERIGPEIMSQLMLKRVQCGKRIDESSGLDFVPRRLRARNGDILHMDSVRGDSHRVVLIVAEPGMGKTTLMTHLAKAATSKENSSLSWVVLLKLNDCTKLLKEIGPGDMTQERVMEFLEKCVLTLGNGLERLLFTSLQNNLQVFIDGVDEVCPHFEDQIMSLLKGLKASIKLTKLYVASRPIFQSKLKKALAVDSLELEYFTSADQENFFNTAWKRMQPSISDEDSDRFTTSLLTLVRATWQDTNPILGVPLMAHMLKEIHEECLRKFVVDGELAFAVKLDILFLYEEFVKKKYDIYTEEKKKTFDRDLSAVQDDEKLLMENFLQNHREASLQAIFKDEVKDVVMDSKNDFLKRQAEFHKKVTLGEEKVGIIDNVVDNVPHFVHRPFAEYFAACWLADNYQKNRKIMERIMFSPIHKHISEMFNRLLAKNSSLKIHNAVLNWETEKLYELLKCSAPTALDALDAGDRSPLHLAVYLYGIEKHNDYLEIAHALLQQNFKTNVADKVLGWRPLKYADRFKAWTIAGVILAAGGEVTDMPSLLSIRENFRSQFIDFIKPDASESLVLKEPNDDLMLDAAKDAGMDVVRYLIEERKGSIDCRGPLGETMAHKAAEGGDVDLLRYLVAQTSPRYATLLYPDYESSNLFHYAALGGGVEVIRYLDEEGFDKNAVNSSQETPLHVSVTQGTNLDVLEALAKIANVNAVDKDRNTPLQISARRGNYEVMAILINHGSSIETDTSKLIGEQPKVNLLCAAFAGDLSKVRVLMECDENLKGAFLDFTDHKGNSVIDVATKGQHLEVVEYFLRKSGEDPGDSLLHIASRIGKDKIVSFLLGRNAEIDSANDSGKTSLHLASEHGHLNVVEVLINEGADYKTDQSGSFPLHSAVQAGGSHGDVVELLVCHYINNLDDQDSFGRTALALASKCGHLGLVKIIDRGGAKMLVDRKGNTPLHLASLEGHEEVVEYLAELVADVNVKNEDGETPIFLATKGGGVAAMERLLSFGAEITANKDGSTPMHVAAAQGNRLTLECLLKHGAKKDPLDNSLQTPLKLAESAGLLNELSSLLTIGAR